MVVKISPARVSGGLSRSRTFWCVGSGCLLHSEQRWWSRYLSIAKLAIQLPLRLVPWLQLLAGGAGRGVGVLCGLRGCRKERGAGQVSADFVASVIARRSRVRSCLRSGALTGRAVLPLLPLPLCPKVQSAIYASCGPIPVPVLKRQFSTVLLCTPAAAIIVIIDRSSVGW